RDWKSRWFDRRKFRALLEADIRLREWLGARLAKMYVSRIEIERSPAVLHVMIHTSRPGLIIGRSGAGATALKDDMLRRLAVWGFAKPPELKLTIEEVKNPETDAAIVGQMVAEGLERRLPFRRVLKQTLSKVSAHKEVKGVKIALSGRLGGAEMSRREWLMSGQIPLQTIRADIDFSRQRAHLPYGDIGIKIWIYKGEVFETKKKPI
ncbi:MAG: 30S ribosomal protein S3, partial [Candidatus Niyogibacteria bacterium]|nr:30S ribosomal protein S3 [Candidatus Niyogibacteria bacterium]